MQTHVLRVQSFEWQKKFKGIKMDYYGNLAYKPSMPKKRISEDEIKRKNKEKEQAQMLARKVTIIRIVYILVLALSATFMISKFVAVYDTEQEIKTLTKNLEQKQSYSSQKIFEMEQKVDLAEIEKIATTELGMQRPDKHQIIYVDVKTEDVTEVTAGEVESAKNRNAGLFDTIKKNIIGIFSIN